MTKKQLKDKAERKRLRDDDKFKAYHCPDCGEKDAILEGNKYCFNCGQALDWSDEDDRQ